MHENDTATIAITEGIALHKLLGPGLLESVYEECLIYKLLNRGLFVERQKPIPLVMDGVKLECGFRCDIIVERKLIIEVKAVESLNDIHLAQVLAYLKLTNVKLGLLMNFNVVRLMDGVKRVVNGL